MKNKGAKQIGNLNLGNYEKDNRVYSPNAASPTISTKDNRGVDSIE